MITSIKVLEAFENAENPDGPEGGTERGYAGFSIEAFPVGHKVDTNSPLVVLIGDNGSGKSTVLEKLEAQFMGWGMKHWYFDVTCDEQEEPDTVWRCDLTYDPEANYRNRELRSHGQYKLGEIPKFLKGRGTKRLPQDILTIDEPESGISLRNKRRLVNTIHTYAFEKRRQIWVATHEPEFLKLPGVRIINLDEHPAKSYLSSEFDLERYLGATE